MVSCVWSVFSDHMHNYSAVWVALRATPDLLVLLLAGFIAQHGIKLSLSVAMQFSKVWQCKKAAGV